MVALLSRIDAPTKTMEKMAKNPLVSNQVESVIRRVQEWQSIHALLNAVDKKDRYTRFHSEDVLYHTILIAQQLSLNEREQEDLFTAALLHDVGKIGVSNTILQAPRPLYPEEMLLMRQHPALGASVISQMDGSPAVVSAILHHHESWDGAGYPGGLKGEEIPRMARILAVADTYSALIHDRPYRNGISPRDARAVLESGAGVQWDPVYVSALLHAFRKPRFH